MEFSLDKYLDPEVKEETEKVSEKLRELESKRQDLIQRRKKNIADEDKLNSIKREHSNSLQEVKKKKKILEKQVENLIQKENFLEEELTKKGSEITDLVKTRKMLKDSLKDLDVDLKQAEKHKNNLPNKKNLEVCKAFDKYLKEVAKNIASMQSIFEENKLILADKKMLEENEKFLKYYEAWNSLKEYDEELSNNLYKKIKKEFPYIFNEIKTIEPITLYFSRNKSSIYSLFLPIQIENLESEGLPSQLAFCFLGYLNKYIKSDESLASLFFKKWLIIQSDYFEEDLIEINLTTYGNLPFIMEELEGDISEVLSHEII